MGQILEKVQKEEARGCLERTKCQYFTIVAKFLCQMCRSDTLGFFVFGTIL